MSEVRDTFMRATLALAKKGGPEWFEFVQAFNLYVGYELERGLKAPTSDLHIAVGINRGMVALRDIFRDIDKK